MSLAKKSSSYFVRDIFLLFTNLVTSIVIARTLGPEIMGIWLILNFIPTYADLFFRTKVDISAVYLLSKGKYEIGDIKNTLNVIASITGAIILLLIFLFLETISTNLLKENSSVYKDYILLIIVSFPLNLFYQNYFYLHNYYEDVRSMNFMILTRVLFMSLISIPGLIFFDFKIIHLVLCFIGSYFLALIIGALRLRVPKGTGPFLNINLIKDLFVYAYKLYLTGVSVNLNLYLANTFLLFYGSASQIAFYALAQQYSLTIAKVTDSMNTFLFPMTSKKNSEDSKQLISKAFRVAIIIMVPTIFLCALLIYPAVFIFYGQAFLPIVYPFLILLIGVIFSSISSPTSVYFMSTGRPEIITQITIIPIIVQLLLSPFIIPAYGISGAATIMSLGMILVSFVLVLFFLKKTNLNFKNDMSPKKEDFLIVKSFLRNILNNFYRRNEMKVKSDF